MTGRALKARGDGTPIILRAPPVRASLFNSTQGPRASRLPLATLLTRLWRVSKSNQFHLTAALRARPENLTLLQNRSERMMNRC